MRGGYRLAAELVTLIYVALIAEVASATGAYYVMCPELGALSQDVFTRPRGTWARAPILLAITPVLTAAIGIVVTRALPYGEVSVLCAVLGAIAVIELLKSPVAPAISAGLLPLVLGVKSWWYPPGVALGTILLAVLSIPWSRSVSTESPPPSGEDALEDELELAPTRTGYRWVAALIAFVVVAVVCVDVTGLRFILFPPLVVIGFEMFGHAEVCPWADRPLLLPVACLLTAAGGYLFWRELGVGWPAAACSIAWGIGVLRVLDLHVPPALAVALLPQVMEAPTAMYPVAVGLGTSLLTIWFVGYRRMFERAA